MRECVDELHTHDRRYIFRDNKHMPEMNVGATRAFREWLKKIWPEPFGIKLPSIGQVIGAFADYYDKRKSFINFTGFIGVIAALFLQVSLGSGDPAAQSLRVVQAFFLVAFCVFVAYLLVDFQQHLYRRFVKSLWTFMFIVPVFLTVIAIFFYHLAVFVLTEFGSGLMPYWQWARYELVIPAALAFESVNGWIKSNPDKAISKAVTWATKIFIFLRYVFYATMVSGVAMALMGSRPSLGVYDAHAVTGMVMYLSQLVICFTFAFLRKDRRFYARYLFGTAAAFVAVNAIVFSAMSR